MTVSTELLLGIGILDVLLLLGSYITYLRILGLQNEYERIGTGF
jgi:hypothetical protein